MTKVNIVPNSVGGYSIRIGKNEIGNYATVADATKVVKLNGFILE